MPHVATFRPLISEADLETVMTVKFPSIEAITEPKPIVTQQRERTPLRKLPAKDNSRKGAAVALKKAH